MKTTKHLIDWEAYKQGLEQLSNSGNSAPTASATNLHARDRPTTADPGTELLARQAEMAENAAQTLAWGNVGSQLGNLAGKGLASVDKDDGTKPVFAAIQHHNKLQQLLGERLHQNYQLKMKLDDDAEHREADRQQQLALAQLKGDQELQRQQQRHLLEAAKQTMVDDPNADAQPPTAAKKTTATRGASQRTKPADLPYRITDTDGKQVFGHWELSSDEAAQLLQTAIDLGDQAQLTYVAQLAGTDPNADRKTTTARLLSLQQKALMGNADARQRMVRLLSAIIPSLKGKNVIDGILKQKYRKR